MAVGRAAAAALVVGLSFGASGPAAGFERVAERLESPAGPLLAGPCQIAEFDVCSCFVWIWTLPRDAVWGTILDPQEMPANCAAGVIRSVRFATRCAPGAPASLDDVRIQAVDASGCPTATLWSSGPVTVTHCSAADMWTSLAVPDVAVPGGDFVVALEIGPTTPRRVRLVSDSGIANLYCRQGTMGFPGCDTGCSCPGWVIPPVSSYIFADDFDGNTVVDDLCAVYGMPYPLAFPYVAGYGYLPNNLLLEVQIDPAATSVEEGAAGVTSWGRVKALYGD